MNTATLPILLVLVLAISLALVGQTGGTDAELLQRLDEVRFPDGAITSIQVRITATSPDDVRVAEVIVYVAERDGASFARIDFLAPDELAGQIYLSTPEATFFFSPDLDFPIKTSANVELFGDAAVAQTSGIRFAEDYDIAERSIAVGEDGSEWLELELIARDPTTAFQSITLAVDPQTLLPRSGRLFGLSGFPFYDVAYEVYETLGEDDLYVATQRIVSLVFEGRETLTETVEISSAELPEDWFDPASLGATRD